MSRVVRTRTPQPAQTPGPRRSTVGGKGFVASKASDKHGAYHEEQEDFDVYTQEFTDDNPPAYVKTSAGMTINLGNYESLRIDCSVSLPVDRRAIDAGFTEASDIVYRRLNDEQTRWLGEASASTDKKGKR